MFSSSEVVELVQRNNVTHASERQHGGNVAPGDDYLVAPPTAMLGRLSVTRDSYSDWHKALDIVLIRKQSGLILLLLLLLF